MKRRLLISFLVLGVCRLSAATEDNVTPWRQDQPPNQPYSPPEAVRKMTVPEGFTVELVASEPDIVNPIAMSFDDRGRIWITESIEYPRKPAGVGRDRLKILEGTAADGRAEKVSVFAEGLNIPTGVAIGHGGVWVLNAPDLLFMREKDGRETSREVVVTGFGRTDTHELPNSLTWGPDGWLYGLNGVFNQSRIRSNNGTEYKFNCALWRVHPRTREFQIVSEGTSNPYGIAWDTEGSAIVEACHWANDHLFHFVETGHYQRQAGTFPPFTMPIGSITDHGHQKTAYCGIANLDTDAYPAHFRERIVVGNIHGGSINVDRLQRDGATYLAKGEPDLMRGNDGWFMPVALKIGPDGCLYVLDWYDRYHCSQDAARDPEGVDRLKGRLYRLRYKNTPRAPKVDLASESGEQLIARLASGNIYFRETAQRILTERLGSASRDLRAKLEKLVLTPGEADVRRLTAKSEIDQSLVTPAATSIERKARLHALWALIGSGTLDPAFHRKVLAHSDPAYRAWGVRAAGNFGTVSSAIRGKVAALARDPSPDVQLQVAIASRKIKNFDALPVLSDVLAHSGQDKLIPSITWNNLHPLLETESTRFVSLQKTLPPALAALSPRIVERILSAPNPDESAVASFIKLVANHDSERAKECLSAVSSKLSARSEPLAAQLQTALKPILQELLARESDTPLFLSAQLLAARLGLAQVAPAAVRARFTSTEQPEAMRLQALDALVAFRDPALFTALPAVISGSPQFTRRVFASLGRVEDPKLADVLLTEYPKLAPELQPLAIDLIMQREPWARKLLDAVLANKLPKGVLNANHLRKILESNDRDALWAVEKAFGKIREERNPEREKVVAEMATYFREHIGDPHRGQTVFRNLCAQCHTIYGEGAKVGPDISANGRASFEQLLSNVFDPSLVIGPAYQVTTVVTKDGRNLTGLITEDNEQRVVVRMPGEGEETISRNNVKYTRVSKLSMMPEGIETLLDKKDLSDLFAFLSLDQPPTDKRAKLIPGAPEIPKQNQPAKPTGRIKVESSEKRLIVRAQSPGNGWSDLATFVMETNSRPYLHPLRDASGRVVLTEDRPADHPWQHGIFTGFHRVNGFNYWKEDEGKQRFVRLLDLKEDSDRVSWRALVELVAPNGNVVLEEEDSITIYAPESPDTYLIDFDCLVRAKEQDVNFGKFFVGGLSVRMPWDSISPRQTHLNSNGQRDRECEQQRAAWCNVERPFGNESFGIAVFDHPANVNHPSGWRVDEQGLINPNVSALGDWSLPAKQERVFRHRLVVYRGSATREQLAARFAIFADDSRGGVNPGRNTAAVGANQRGTTRDASLDAAFQLVRHAVETNHVPGAIALVARDGRVVRQEAYGLRDIENQLPFTTNTLCWIASITKPVTVSAAMTLVDAGKLALDDPVEKYLPDFQQQTDTNGAHHVVTIRHLMSHTSGLVPNPPTRRSAWPIGGPLDDFWLQQNLPEIVRTIARSQLLFKPGAKFEYSNSALFVLGRIIEVISGQAYAAYVREKILAPLGMHDTHFAPPPGATNRIAIIYGRRAGKRETVFRHNPAVKISNAAPDGGLFSYPAQFVPFLQMFLNADGRVLSQSAVAGMLKEQTPGWGLGWSLPDGLFLHEGSSGSVAWADPKTSVIGILFLQYRDQNKADERLRKEFRTAVQKAFADTGD